MCKYIFYVIDKDNSLWYNLFINVDEESSNIKSALKRVNDSEILTSNFIWIHSSSSIEI